MSDSIQSNEERFAKLEAAIRQNRNSTSRSEGYVNYRRETDPLPFPETQTFAGNLGTTVASATGSSGTSTVTWTSVDLSGLVPKTAEYAVLYFTSTKTTSSTAAASLQMRRDEQPDSASFDAVNLNVSNGFGNGAGADSQIIVPIGTMGERTFQYRITGTITGLTWVMSLRGYYTRKRNAEDANSSGDVGSGGTSFDTGGAGL